MLTKLYGYYETCHIRSLAVITEKCLFCISRLLQNDGSLPFKSLIANITATEQSKQVFIEKEQKVQTAIHAGQTENLRSYICLHCRHKMLHHILYMKLMLNWNYQIQFRNTYQVHNITKVHAATAKKLLHTQNEKKTTNTTCQRPLL